MEVILTNIKRISNRVYYIIPNVRYKDRLELKGINSTILKGTEIGSLRRDNTYRKY